MQNAVAFANNDVITVAWSYGQKLERCMGFAVYRIDPDGQETALPAVAVFPGFKRAAGDTCEKFPIQKFYWKDVYARLVAEKTGQRKFRYKIVPLEGAPGTLVPMTIPQVTSNEVEITARLSDGLHAYFNRGLISTQRISRAERPSTRSGPESSSSMTSPPEMRASRASARYIVIIDAGRLVASATYAPVPATSTIRRTALRAAAIVWSGSICGSASVAP